MSCDSILHIVSASYPSQSGYVIRTEKILDLLCEEGLKITVIGSIFSKRNAQLTRGKSFIHNERLYYQLLNKPLQQILLFFEKIPIIRILFHYLEILINTLIILIRVRVSDYEIIHGHSTFRNGISAFIISRLYSKPLIYDIHALGIDAHKPNTIKYKLEYFFEGLIINNAKAVIAIDENLEKSLKKRFKIDDNKIFIAPNGIDMGVFFNRKKMPQNNILQYIPEEKVVIGIDNSKPVEGFELIINNFEEIIAAIPNLHFIVFGDKKMSLKSQHITCLPKLPIAEMPIYYSMVDLFVLPRRKNRQSDTITPLKILELMSCEVPVLVSNVKGLTHCIQDGHTGYVFYHYTKEGLIEAIKFVLDDKKTPLITRNAKKWVKDNKSWAKTVKGYCECYKYITRG